MSSQSQSAVHQLPSALWRHRVFPMLTASELSNLAECSKQWAAFVMGSRLPSPPSEPASAAAAGSPKSDDDVHYLAINADEGWRGTFLNQYGLEATDCLLSFLEENKSQDSAANAARPIPPPTVAPSSSSSAGPTAQDISAGPWRLMCRAAEAAKHVFLGLPATDASRAAWELKALPSLSVSLEHFKAAINRENVVRRYLNAFDTSSALWKREQNSVACQCLIHANYHVGDHRVPVRAAIPESAYLAPFVESGAPAAARAGCGCDVNALAPHSAHRSGLQSLERHSSVGCDCECLTCVHARVATIARRMAQFAHQLLLHCAKAGLPRRARVAVCSWLISRTNALRDVLRVRAQQTTVAESKDAEVPAPITKAEIQRNKAAADSIWLQWEPQISPLHCFLSRYDFHGLDMELALRSLLSIVEIPASGRNLNWLLGCFSRIYVNQNLGRALLAVQGSSPRVISSDPFARPLTVQQYSNAYEDVEESNLDTLAGAYCEVMQSIRNHPDISPAEERKEPAEISDAVESELVQCLKLERQEPAIDSMSPAEASARGHLRPESWDTVYRLCYCLLVLNTDQHGVRPRGSTASSLGLERFAKTVYQLLKETDFDLTALEAARLLRRFHTNIRLFPLTPVTAGLEESRFKVSLQQWSPSTATDPAKSATAVANPPSNPARGGILSRLSNLGRSILNGSFSSSDDVFESSSSPSASRMASKPSRSPKTTGSYIELKSGWIYVWDNPSSAATAIFASDESKPAGLIAKVDLRSCCDCRQCVAESRRSGSSVRLFDVKADEDSGHLASPSLVLAASSAHPQEGAISALFGSREVEEVRKLAVSRNKGGVLCCNIVAIAHSAAASAVVKPNALAPSHFPPAQFVCVSVIADTPENRNEWLAHLFWHIHHRHVARFGPVLKCGPAGSASSDDD